MKTYEERYENYTKWIKEIDKYMDVICSESAVNMLFNINGSWDVKEIQKITGAKSLMTIYNIRNNLSKLHLIEFKKEKPNLSALGYAVKDKLLKLEQLMNRVVAN